MGFSGGKFATANFEPWRHDLTFDPVVALTLGVET